MGRITCAPVLPIVGMRVFVEQSALYKQLVNLLQPIPDQLQHPNVGKTKGC